MKLDAVSQKCPKLLVSRGFPAFRQVGDDVQVIVEIGKAAVNQQGVVELDRAEAEFAGSRLRTGLFAEIRMTLSAQAGAASMAKARSGKARPHAEAANNLEKRRADPGAYDPPPTRAASGGAIVTQREGNTTSF